MTILNGTVINQSGPAAFVNVTNGGTLTLAGGLASPATFTGFNNQGSGAITIGAVNVVNVADFQSYGLLRVNPATFGSGQLTLLDNTGTSAMYFNGGSRTFNGALATAQANVASVDLYGQNLVIAGGLFINNGFVADSTGTPGTVIVDFGALYVRVRAPTSLTSSPRTAARCRPAIAPAPWASVDSSSAPAA